MQLAKALAAARPSSNQTDHEIARALPALEPVADESNEMVSSDERAATADPEREAERPDPAIAWDDDAFDVVRHVDIQVDSERCPATEPWRDH